MRDDVDESLQGNGGGGTGHRSTEPLLNLPPAVMVAVVFLVGVHSTLSVIGSLAPDSGIPDLIYFLGGFIPARYHATDTLSSMAAVWTPLTYSFLHGGWQHLIFNMIWLAVFGSPVARRIGSTRFAVLWVVLSVVSAFAFYILNPGSVSLVVGASGVISGLTGAACRFAWSPARLGSGGYGPLLSVGEALSNRSVMSFMLIWLLANVGFAALGGFAATPIAWESHLGGFVAGFFLLPIFDKARR